MTIKIRLNTWARNKKTKNKFKRNIAPRVGFVEYCPSTKKVSIKNGEKKWKTWDTTISRKADVEYIEQKKELYSGLCFSSRKEAKKFIKKHASELNKLASENPLFSNWSIMTVIKRFEPENKTLYK